jgi:hypothetical protein
VRPGGFEKLNQCGCGVDEYTLAANRNQCYRPQRVAEIYALPFPMFHAGLSAPVIGLSGEMVDMKYPRAL